MVSPRYPCPSRRSIAACRAARAAASFRRRPGWSLAGTGSWAAGETGPAVVFRELATIAQPSASWSGPLQRGRNRRVDRIALPAPPTAPEVARAALRRMVALVVGASAFSCLLVLSFGYALHAPRPHDLRVDVVAAGPVTGRVRAALDAAAPGAFTVRAVGGAGAARQDVRHDVAAGALVVGSSGALTGYVASAAGLQVEQAVMKAIH